MALRDQPYFPLYVQDYLTDEQLNICSWSTQGIYIKILCILHKQKEYGTILFKQNDKQNVSTCLDFASILIRLLPCQMDEMVKALEELIENGVLIIEGNKLYQKRMVKDGKISIARSTAGKIGGGNPNLFKQKSKQKSKQNPEYENEYENENINIDFDIFWNLYDKKVGKKEKIEKKWIQLTDSDRNAIIEYVPTYIESRPEKKYRKNPETFLNNKSWLDEIITITKHSTNGKSIDTEKLFD
jgi:uncharacterized protein YdaU (DUF1376 family)